MLASAFAALLAAASPPSAVLAPLPALYPSLEATYQELHRSPELSLQETKTAAKLAAKLRDLGYEVTTGVGGNGVVGVLRNGKGPTVLLRTELDALPVKEETGLAYASTVTAAGPGGDAVPVMHACGHDVHMTSWLGAATLLAKARDRWSGTLVLMGQPAEEVVRGARAMIDAGLLTRFPRPDYAIAIHDHPWLRAGQVAVTAGPSLAAVDTVELVVHGRGGHGAAPQLTIDPVLIASRVVVALQGIVARELNPLDPAVVTVGSIHGGTKSNIIPDDVKLQLTVRSFKPEVQKHLLDAIARVAKGEAMASGAPEPTVTVTPDSARPLVNDPKLSERLRGALARGLGEDAIAQMPPLMVSEDFSELGYAGIPAVQVWVGASRDEAAAEAARVGKAPGLHTARFAPDVAPTLRTGVATFTIGALELLGRR
ncbi:MAG TPA: amidohydrolase [Anaeromyxobacter sp.]